MAISFDNNDDFFGGDSQRLAEAGTYHFLVAGASEQPTTGKGSLIPNAILQLNLTVQAGPHIDKTLDLTYFGLKGDASEKARTWHNRKLIRIAYASGLIGNPEIMGKIPAVDYTKAKGRQIIVHVDFGTNQDGEKREHLEMVFANVWHIDDPAAPKEVVKDANTISFLPQNLRRTPEYFAELRKYEEAKKAGAKPGSNNQPAPTTNATSSTTSNVGVEELV